MKKIPWIIIHLLIKASILLVFVSFYLSIFEKELLKSWVEALRDLVVSLGSWNYLIAFLSSLIESFPVLWIALPSQNILMAIAWFYWNISATFLFYIIVLASFWAIIWNFIWFFLWKKYWISFIDRYGLWVWVWYTEVKYLKKSMHKWWAMWIILWKFHPTTRTFLPFIAWISWMTSIKFAIYNIIGSIIWAITIIIMGLYFAEYYETVIDHAWKIMIWLAFISVLYIWKFKKKEFKEFMIEKNAEMDRKYWTKK